MNKLKKLGLTALGTSLVASSAIAADASLTGNVGYTWSSEEVGTSTTDGIGYEADFNMVVSGEMDNGWTATGSLLLTESATLSSSWTSLTMGSMGTIIVGNGYGGVGQAFDDVTPRAYEENHDGMKTSTAIDNIGAAMDNGQILYMSPAFDIAGFSASLMAEYAPEASDAPLDNGSACTDATRPLKRPMSSRSHRDTPSHQSASTVSIMLSTRSERSRSARRDFRGELAERLSITSIA